MSTLRYPHAAIVGDLLRGGSGALLLALPLVAGDPPAWLQWTMLPAVLVCGVFALAAARRMRARFVLADDALRVQPGTACIEWASLDALQLSYYCTRRDGRGGWLQLRLRAGARTVRVDSRLGGFQRVLARAVRAARERDVELGSTTLANLAALGIDVGERRA